MARSRTPTTAATATAAAAPPPAPPRTVCRPDRGAATPCCPATATRLQPGPTPAGPRSNPAPRSGSAARGRASARTARTRGRGCTRRRTAGAVLLGTARTHPNDTAAAKVTAHVGSHPRPRSRVRGGEARRPDPGLHDHAQPNHGRHRRRHLRHRHRPHPHDDGGPAGRPGRRRRHPPARRRRPAAAARLRTVPRTRRRQGPRAHRADPDRQRDGRRPRRPAEGPRPLAAGPPGLPLRTAAHPRSPAGRRRSVLRPTAPGDRRGLAAAPRRTWPTPTSARASNGNCRRCWPAAAWSAAPVPAPRSRPAR